MKFNGLIYVITNKITNKCYIGQTTQKLDERISKHISASNNGSDQLIHKSIRKNGISNFKIEILKYCDSMEELNAYEDKLINEYNSIVPNGYNLKSGGHNVVYSVESKLKMSLAHKGKSLSEEHKTKIKESCKGKIGPWLGKVFSDEHKKNISKGNTGKIFSKETIVKLSQAKMGENNSMFGKSGSQNPNAKEVTLICPDGSIEHFDTLTDACNKYDMDIRNLSAVVLEKRKSHRGFRLYKQ